MSLLGENLEDQGGMIFEPSGGEGDFPFLSVMSLLGENLEDQGGMIFGPSGGEGDFPFLSVMLPLLIVAKTPSACGGGLYSDFSK